MEQTVTIDAIPNIQTATNDIDLSLPQNDEQQIITDAKPDESLPDMSDIVSENTDISAKKVDDRPKIPSHLAANIKKHQDMLDRLGVGKKKPPIVSDKKPEPVNDIANMMRVYRDGKYRYIPIDSIKDVPVVQTVKKQNEILTLDEIAEKKKDLELQINSSTVKVQQIRSSVPEAAPKRIPSKYAKQIDDNIKKIMLANVKNLSDANRIKLIDNIGSGASVDFTKAGINELKRYAALVNQERILQKKEDDAQNKKKTIVETINSDPSLSRYEKMFSIRNACNRQYNNA